MGQHNEQIKHFLHTILCHHKLDWISWPLQGAFRADTSDGQVLGKGRMKGSELGLSVSA